MNFSELRNKTFALMYFLFVSSAFLFAQNNKNVTIKEPAISLKEALHIIEKQVNMPVAFNETQLKDTKLNINIINQPFEQALSEVLKSSGFSYVIKDGYIMIVREANSKEKTTSKITGMVIDEQELPLIGVNIRIKGKPGVGTITDLDGKFSITVSPDEMLEVSYIGYTKNSVKVVDNKNYYSIKLSTDAKVLEEVVVTAMGIERKAESLTYATQTVGGNELTRMKEANLINSLQGKSAGLTITPNAGGAGGASKILLRGNASMLGNNSPLIIVDGVPMQNGVSGQMKMGDGYNLMETGSGEGSDALSQLNPDDIESITVLKGANSAALYGSAASNGVLMIKTKKGQEGNFRIDVSSSTTFETPLSLPKMQNVYGSNVTGGLENGFSISGDSWGNKLSEMTPDQLNTKNSVQRLTNSPYDIQNFFQLGTNLNNSVSLSGGTKKAQTYFSYGNTTAKGITPRNKFQRHNITLRENFSFFEDRLKVSVSASYINQTTTNRPRGGVAYSPLFNLYTAARNADMDYYKSNYTDYNGTWVTSPYDIIVKKDDPNNPGKQITTIEKIQTELSSAAYGKQVWYMQDATKRNNPWWLINRKFSENSLNHIFGTLSASYQIMKELSLQARVKYDYEEEQYEHRQYATTMTPESMDTRGRWIWRQNKNNDFYGDFMLSYNKVIGDYSLGINGGGSMMNSTMNYWNFTPNATSGAPYQEDKSCNQFILSDMYLKTGTSQGGLPTKNWERAIFATGQITYKDIATIEGSYRDDWYRTFTQFRDMSPHFAYYSLGASSVLSNLWKFPSYISELKLRASYSEVGNSIPNSLFLASANRDPATGAYIMNANVEFKNPKPETTSSFETGFDLGLFDRSLNIEATYYHAVMKNQFMSYAGSAGKKVFVNGGKVLNQGVELSATYILAPNHDFSWKTGLNFSYNDNKILSTAKKSDGKDLKYEIDMGKSSGLKVKFITGGSYGDLYGVDYMYNENNEIVVNPKNGRPFKQEGQASTYLGNMNAKYNLGWHNTINYKSFQFYFLIDGKIGGKVISFTEAYLDYYGVSERTAEARLMAEQQNIVWTNKDGTTIPGYYLPNGQLAGLQPYFESTGGETPLGANYVYDATNFRLREISAAYTFKNVFGSGKHLTASLNARNLFFIYKDAPIDPDTSLSTQNALGNVDIFSMPTTRSYGFSLKATF